MDFKIRPETKSRSPKLFVVVFEYRNKKKGRKIKIKKLLAKAK